MSGIKKCQEDLTVLSIAVLCDRWQVACRLMLSRRARVRMGVWEIVRKWRYQASPFSEWECASASEASEERKC